MPAFVPGTALRRVSSRPPARRPVCAAFRDNVDALPPARGSELHLLAFRNLSTRAPSFDLVLRNEPGKTASFRIFSAVAAERNGLLDAEAARDILDIYAEIVDEARATPGSHATVDFALSVAEESDVRFVCRLDGNYF